MIKRVDIALAVSKKSESDESSLINYTGGFIGESGNYYPFECNCRCKWVYDEMRSRVLDRGPLSSHYYDSIDKAGYKHSDAEIIYNESIFINE